MKGIQKKKVYSIITIVMIIILLISIAFTYSKYSALEVINAQANIASWKFDISVNGITNSKIDLASTYDKNTLVNGKIAPGTKGSFNFCLDATGSEVGIDYQIEFINVENHPNNLIYKYDDLITNDITELESKLNGEISAVDSNKVRNITIEWEWPYETSNENSIIANDKLDTQIGLNANDYILNVCVTARQVLPK